jgi:hypothetical protein
MERAILEKTIIDMLIRAKLAGVPECHRVEALPIAWRAATGTGCNWIVPGWTGDSRRVSLCTKHIAHYVSFLQAQFDIPEERHGP